MGWIIASIVVPILGFMMIPRFRPANRGKLKPLKAFTIAYPTGMVNCVVFTAFAMVGVMAMAAWKAPQHLQDCAIYYTVYVICIGFVVAAAMLLGRRSISINGETIAVSTRLFGKPVEYKAAELACLDVRKTEVRVLKADGTLMFSAGVMMENLDMFFAWTHARPGIRLTMNGKELPKNGSRK